MFAVFNKVTNKQLSKECNTIAEARSLLLVFTDKSNLIVKRIVGIG